MGDNPLPASADRHGIVAKLTSFISRVCQIPPKLRIELMGVKGRLKALSRERLVIYLGVSALIVIMVSFKLASMFTPPTIPDFELEVKNWYYNPSAGSFIVSGSIGNKVPPKYWYNLYLSSITDGNKTITRFSDLGSTSVTFHVSQWRPDMGTDWTFLIGEGVTLESKNVQLTIKYVISYGSNPYVSPDVLERGSEVFSVNVEDA